MCLILFLSYCCPIITLKYQLDYIHYILFENVNLYIIHCKDFSFYSDQCVEPPESYTCKRLLL